MLIITFHLHSESDNYGFCYPRGNILKLAMEMHRKIEVVSFDLDGVLYDGPSAVYPVAKELGLEKQFISTLKKVTEKELPLNDSIREGAKIWKGIPVDGTLDHIIEEMPLMKGAEETVSTLKEWGYTVGCISSGVSQFFLKPLKRRLDLDFAYSNTLGEIDGKHDGSVEYIMGPPQKAQAAQKVLSEYGLTNEVLASIGDGENDIPLFHMSEFSIAFNPESPAVSDAATLTILSKDLRSILPHFIKDVL
ncbi:HAD family hydrolase [Candidatus Thorarchaeota archaeon]|nr:MAG: HAD family hydrolase [Candidatus Thorarchaeota archaeon]